MRTIVVVCLFAVVAVRAAVLPEESYLPAEGNTASGYLPPSDAVAEVKEAVEAPEDTAVLADDGYQYKTVRRLKYRQRRDVSEIANDYLPPVEEPSNDYLPPAEVKEAVEPTEDSAVLSDDGYRYKTVRRLKYRNRRDVSEVATAYLPPSEEVTEVEEVPEVKEAEFAEAPEESAVLADDGYQYKTVRRLKYRQRRDVSEVANDYLPPVEEPSNDYLPPAEVKEAVEPTEDSAVLSDDGYRYKTVRRLKYRNRRDVPEVAPVYLPPSEEVTEVEDVPEVKEAEVAEAPEESAVLADDGYQYKTVRRLKYRQRRDVSEVANDYLPPVEEPTNDYLPPAEVKEAVEPTADSAVLSDDGYRYKTVRRLKYRNRRDVSEVATAYLPPSEEVTEVEEVPETKEAEVAEAPEESAVLADDGYQYKTVRRLKYRQRRDVSEVANDYLPPVEEASTDYLPPADVKEAIEPTKDSAVLSDDGYRYKTVRRLKYRNRRDVSEIVAPEYLPPVEKVADEYLPPAQEVAELTAAPIEESAVLADDGYRYKTIKRIRYRN